MKEIEKGHYSGIESKRMVVIDNEREWVKLMDQVHRNKIPAGAVPSVNFNQEIIIAVFQGMKSTGGYEIEIIDVKNEKDFLEVHVKEIKPGENCMTTQALTQPYHIVSIPRQQYRQIKFINYEEITQCD